MILQILWIGSNDSRGSDEDEGDKVDEEGQDESEMDEQGQVSLTEFHDNLTSIINHPLVTKCHTKVILVTPPPLSMKSQKKVYKNGRIKCIRKAKRTRRYISVVRDCAAENDLLLCDVEKLLLEERNSHKSGLRSLSEDGQRLKAEHTEQS